MVSDGATDVVLAALCVKGGAGLLGSISSVVREGCVCVCASFCLRVSASVYVYDIQQQRHGE